MKELLDFFIGIVFIIIVILIFYTVFNGVAYLVCLSSEGGPYWNKAVFACHFNDTSYVTQTIVQSQSQDCFQNGVRTNCSNIHAWGYWP